MATAIFLLRRGARALIPLTIVLSIGCAGRSTSRDDAPIDPDPAGYETASPSGVAIRFAIEVVSNPSGPIYVLLNRADDQPGWIRASQGLEQIYFRERCDIEDCANRGIVCGAAMPMIRNIANPTQTGVIEFVWDGMTSAIVSGCETRQPAVAGDYVARFCYSKEAEFQDGGDVTQGVPGRLVGPTCTEKPFVLLDKEVVLRI
jgi:hypothetical protein